MLLGKFDKVVLMSRCGIKKMQYHVPHRCLHVHQTFAGRFNVYLFLVGAGLIVGGEGCKFDRILAGEKISVRWIGERVFGAITKIPFVADSLSRLVGKSDRFIHQQTICHNFESWLLRQQQAGRQYQQAGKKEGLAHHTSSIQKWLGNKP